MNTLIDRLSYLYDKFPTLEGERGQTGLVRVSKASKSMVNQWVSGSIKTIGLKFALNIEANLGVSHIWLMTGDGEFMAPIIKSSVAGLEPLVAPPWCAPEAFQLLDLYYSCDESRRGAIFGFAKDLAGVVRSERADDHSQSRPDIPR